MTVRAALAGLVATTTMLAPSLAPAADHRVAVFPFELMDTSTSTTPPKPDAVHQKRLRMITGIIAGAIAEKPGYALVDIAPVKEELAASPAFVDCTGCDTRLAAELGADLVVTGYVHKISLLIIDMAVTIRDVGTGKIVENDAVSIRGDTDESWSHGARFIADHRLLVKARAQD